MNWSQAHLHTPKSLTKALELLHSTPGHWTPFAGGTDLMVVLESGRWKRPLNFLNILELPEFKGISWQGDRLRVGATTSFTELLENSEITKYFRALTQAARHVGARAIQNRATLGGNLANASPAADSSPALLVYDAEVELVSIRGARLVSYSDFHTGYKTLNKESDELIQAIWLNRPLPGASAEFVKVGARAAQAISKVSFCGHVGRSQASSANETSPIILRLALGAVAPYPIRCLKTEQTVLDKKSPQEIRVALDSEISPIDDIRSTAAYRREISWQLVHQFLNDHQLV